MSEQKDSPYHHGDLANTLMDAALAQIAEEGVQKLSLRALAREAGVSATAPYRHFDSKRCLLAALATRGFQQLEHAMSAARQSVEPASGSVQAAEQALMAVALAYVQFAIEYPTTYQMMFGSVIDDFSEYEALLAAAEQAYAVTYGIVLDIQAAGVSPQLDSNVLGATFWSGVHGVADLILSSNARGDQLRGLDLNAPGALQAIVALRQDPQLALQLLFLPLVRHGMQ